MLKKIAQTAASQRWRDGERRGRIQDASLQKAEHIAPKKFLFGPFPDSDLLKGLKELALNPTKTCVSVGSSLELKNQILRMWKVQCVHWKCHRQQKRTFEQFMSGDNFIDASGLGQEESNDPNVKRLGCGKLSSGSCLSNSADTRRCHSMQTIKSSWRQNDLFLSEDSNKRNNLCANFISLDNAACWHPSNGSASPSLGQDKSANGLESSNPANLIVRDASLVDSSDMVQNLDALSSEIKCGRTFKSLVTKDEQPQKRAIPVGPRFQADIPECKGPVDKTHFFEIDAADSERWLGKRIWPMDGGSEETNFKVIGKGRPDSCPCATPGSIQCSKRHIRKARHNLQSELGLAFSIWKFDEMGDVVSNSWVLEERIRFESLLKNNSFKNIDDFWECSLKHFPSKCLKNILSYYYNVYIPKRLSKLTRSSLDCVESDEDQIDNVEEEDQVDDNVVA